MGNRKLTDAKTLREASESYIQEVVPDNAPRVQVRETRIAFYAGAAAMRSLFMKGRGMPSHLLDQYIESLDDELKAFSDEIDRGVHHQ